MSLWLVLVACGAITFATRLSFIAAEGRWAAPAWFRKALPFVPIATLTAIVAPGMARPAGAWDLSLANGRLVAGCAAILVAGVTRSTLLTIATGFAVLWAAS